MSAPSTTNPESPAKQALQGLGMTTEVDEEIFHPLLGVLVSSDLIFLPYTETERKLITLMRANDTEQVSQEDISYIKFNHYVFPHLLAAGCGALAALCIWKLDSVVVREARKKEEREAHTYKPPQETAAEPGKEDPFKDLNNLKLSKKRMKGSESLQKYDYFKASQEMAKNASHVESVTGYQLKFQGYRRYLILFSAVYGLGLLHGVCRSRINLYWLSKKYQGKLKDDPSDSPASKGTTLIVKTKPQ